MFDFSHYVESADFLNKQGVDSPELGIILGTGLGSLVAEIEVSIEIPFRRIPNFPEATVEFHKGKLVYGKLKGKTVLAMAGRYHYYEGYSMKQVTFPVRVMHLLGIKTLLVSNAAGGINKAFDKSDLMLITDHINLLPENPLIGKNIDEFGPRFPDMSAAYNKILNCKFQDFAKDLGIDLKEGVYASVAGPNLETAAEYRFLQIIGADAVGMSTVPEVIVANHLGMNVAAISVITDLCDPDKLEPVNIEDIIEAAGVGERQLIKLIKQFCALN